MSPPAIPRDDGEPPSSLARQQTTLRQTAANFKHVQPPSTYNRIQLPVETPSPNDTAIFQNIRTAISLRSKWLFRRQTPVWVNYPPPRHSDYTVFVPPPYDPFDKDLPPPSDHVCQWHSGLVSVYADGRGVMRRHGMFSSSGIKEFAQDLEALMKIVNDPETRSFCYKRLMLLQERFNMYLILNEASERLAQIAVPHRDFYNVRKVDTHGKYLK